MSGLAIFAIEVGPVAVLVPPSSFIRQGTVSDSDVIVSVFGGEGPALVVAQRVACNHQREKRVLNVSRWWETPAHGCSNHRFTVEHSWHRRVMGKKWKERENVLWWGGEKCTLAGRSVIIKAAGWQVIPASIHVDKQMEREEEVWSRFKLSEKNKTSKQLFRVV